MTDLDLAQRAVACRGWRWMPGMRYVSDAWNRDGFDRVPEHLDLVAFQAWVAALPDFRDPATRGCLLELVREAWDDPGLHIQGQYHAGQWRWRFRGGRPHGGTFNRAADVWHETEEAALVAALEAAPERKK